VSYGFRTYKAANGSGASWTSPTQRGLLHLETLSASVAADSVLTRSYPAWVGRTGKHVYLPTFTEDNYSSTASAHTCVWTYPNGVPTLTITVVTAAVSALVYVFIS